jgi:hypothetical protein
MGIALEIIELLESQKENTYLVLNLTDFNEELLLEDEELEEGVGTLKGLTKHIMKAVTGRGGGEHSEVQSTGKLSNAADLYRHVAHAVKNGHTAVVFKNGQPVAAAHPATDNYTAQAKYNVHTHDSQKTSRASRKTGGGKYVRGKYVPPHYYHYDEPNYGQRDAVNHVSNIVHGDEQGNKDFYKKHHIEVRSYATDQAREQKSKERRANRPLMQTNYAKGMSRTKYSDRSDSNVTSHTPAGKFDNIKQAAATKLAVQKLGHLDTPLKRAQELHAELGKHIASGDHASARRTLSTLDDHIREHGIKAEHPKIKDYADTLTGYDSDSKWNRERREKMRAGSDW